MIIYTCITNNKDKELPSIPLVEGCTYIYYSDRDYEESGWERRELQYFNDDPRRIARWHKVNSHLLFPDEDYVLWVDGNVATKENPLKLIEELNDSFLVTSKHPVRTCVYEEFEAVMNLRYDSLKVLEEQEHKYRLLNLPVNIGLPETNVLLRKNCDECVVFNDTWWEEINNHSKRDQLSFNYAMWKHGFKYVLFDKTNRYKAIPHSIPTSNST